MSLRIVEHPIIRERLSRIRDVSSDLPTFRSALHDVARLMCFEATRDLETTTYPVNTPLVETVGYRLLRPLVLVPILRAGMGLLHGFSELLAEAAIGHLGLYRDETTHQPHAYFKRLPPNIHEAEVILIDPMLATGGSVGDAADALKAAGATRIRFVCLIAAPEGVAAFTARHPDVAIYTAALDEKLNENAYIVPGLGDAGDRYFGT